MMQNDIGTGQKIPDELDYPPPYAPPHAEHNFLRMRRSTVARDTCDEYDLGCKAVYEEKDVYWRTCASRQSYRVLTRNPLFAASIVTVRPAQAVKICSVMRHIISRLLLAPSVKTHLLGGVLWSLFGPFTSVYDL